MKIRIRYFASLREITGQNEELLMVDERTSVADIRPLLVTRYPRLQRYVSAETVLHEGDELVFIPPMGGGNLQEQC